MNEAKSFNCSTELHLSVPEQARVEEVGELLADDRSVVRARPLRRRPVLVHDAGDEGIPPALDPPLVEGDESQEPRDLCINNSSRQSHYRAVMTHETHDS